MRGPVRRRRGKRTSLSLPHERKERDLPNLHGQGHFQNRGACFDLFRLTRKPLRYEKLDQLTQELLLGVR